MTNNPIFVALDVNDIQKAEKLATEIKPFVGGLKLGLEFFTSCGMTGLNQIKNIGLPLFIDLKFYDIPNTVTSALQNILDLEPKFTTIHTSGGREMLTACVKLKNKLNCPTNLLGVTLLTSFSDEDIKELGHSLTVKQSIENLAALANSTGLDGIVCSPLEVKLINEKFPNLKLIVPGIRQTHNSQDDQKRTLSAKEAMENGADILVIGRPITQSANPAKAAEEILKEIQ